MSLKIMLKPNEKIFIGGAVIRNGQTHSTFFVENQARILRERDIMREEDADTPCKQIYFVIQLMYMDEGSLAQYHTAYWKIVNELTDSVKSMRVYVAEISEYLLATDYYRALKIAKKMIAYEKELIDHATGQL